MRPSSNWAFGVTFVLFSSLLGVSCGSDDESSNDGNSGAGGTKYSGCTTAPDCDGCKSCVDYCSCSGIASDQCGPLCASSGGTSGSGGSPATGGASGSGTGGSGTGGSGTGGSGTGGSGTGGAGGAGGACFADIYGSGVFVPNYGQFNPVMGSHCSGTNHQDIQGVQKVIFFGDSITAMDYAQFPPLTATPALVYRLQLSEKLKQKFPGVEIVDCSKDGAQNVDLLEGDKQFQQCIPSGVEQKKTLVIITNGGNDLKGMAQGHMGPAQYNPVVEQTLTQKRTAIAWLKDPAHFPNGSYVIFGNVYEYTDTSTDMGSCLAAQTQGLSGQWVEGVGAMLGLAEGYMKIAVDTQTDMLFMLEAFCGHGFKRDDPNLQCYRGPGAELYFDQTCIHPSDTGATVLADMFFNVVNE